MSESVGENVNYVNAEYVAKDRGIKIEKISNANASGYKNRIGVKLTTQREVISICGTVFDENVQRIVEINGFTLDIEPKGKMIILKNSDVPGVIGEIGMTLAKHNINIADFRLGRNGNHNALSMILLDEKVDNIVLDELVSLKACLSVAYVEL
jgi:D-3-phosphoglycerate dehydrogenase